MGELPEGPNVERALHYIYEHVNQFYNIKGLHAFKAKFHPHWTPCYLIYPNTVALPSIALALKNASSGGNAFREYLSPLKNAFNVPSSIKVSK